MVRVITQETFNEAVKENVDVLGLPFEEALKETIKQFEAQNVDLRNISKDLKHENIDNSLIVDCIEKLQLCDKNEKDYTTILDSLSILKEQCEKGIEYKVSAGKSGAYEQILVSLNNNKGRKDVEVGALKTMLCLMTKQPDLLDDKGVETIIKYIDLEQDTETLRLVLKWAKECCVLHENNRQKLYDANILDKLKQVLKDANSEVLRDILTLFRALILDDDVRVEFGKAHEHARGIAAETLPTLINFLDKFKSDENVVSDLILTISSLLVRNEFCKQFADVGGLDLIKLVMSEYENHEKINRQCFKLLKALAGNDDCKAQIITTGLAPLISQVLNKNIKSVQTSLTGLSCVAALSLRSPENSRVLFESGIPEALIEIMKKYPKEKNIQKHGSWAIRNMVSRSKSQCGHFIELGAEDILKEALKNFKECEYDVKSALRDLGCDVEFKEEWTGKGGLLNN